MKDVIIVSPHIDDESIGCYSILTKPDIKPIIIYTEDTTEDRKKEALNLRNFVNVKSQLFLRNIPNSLLHKDNIYYFPDPIYETHPTHRLQGIVGEQLSRSGFEIYFYTVNKQAPYIYEIKNPEKKEELLNKVYPSQSDLWKYEKKYILFEGYCKWCF